ncbi:hypothetical protein G7L40_19990 [Paenibacillus polymyxa]|uniref:Uncharacterized protein n=1 Tax=Paenibacillus polymyxa TaxID=1406 RepID=A0A378Y191_PAEPO|nr:hypothetical protein [Paenibacillus polymyxa]MBE7896230.1 hypothetical protein [Paenibacillus polymyxa]MBG9765842.1 hypothetical protein [Paenibacillus polymyxa]MCC3256759.1 hypothetical protein [Paenibacillus polymyxa]QPK54754.1 hypothetical protein G7035_20030 [Paenibacillus polymyxa]QPK59845.1 hypothetical protein G7L40_19990 [Paenibacillus polymyxa]
MKHIYHGMLLLIAVIFIVYGIVVIFFKIEVSPFISSVITVFSFIVSLMILLFALLRKVATKFYKGVTILCILIMIAVISRSFMLLYTGEFEKTLDINLLSNYSTIVAFGVSLVAFVLDGSNNTSSKRYVLTRENKLKLKKGKL